LDIKEISERLKQYSYQDILSKWEKPTLNCDIFPSASGPVLMTGLNHRIVACVGRNISTAADTC
jgi:hypothetical protein